MNRKNGKNGFSLLEVLAVIVIIGILSALAWVNMNELIQTNKAKEAARTLTAFAERALAESKTRKEAVTISLTGSTMQAQGSELLLNQSLVNGFSVKESPKPDLCGNSFLNNVTSQIRIGISGIDGAGCFIVCNSSNYCGSAVKTTEKNSFTAYIKKKNSNSWEAL